MNRILIDTNIYSDAMRGNNDTITILQRAELIGISTISIGELLSGFKGGNRENINKNQLGEFLDSPRVEIFPADMGTADFYAQVLNGLRLNGTPIPTNDIWIAAIAFQHGLKLFTLDHHFQKIAGLNML